jgi:hypothetical protein
VDLGNLFALGVAASTGNISGTLVLQTLGISGESISATIPFPSEINNNSIQNAILALGAIKAKIYDENIVLLLVLLEFTIHLAVGQKQLILLLQIY